MKPIKSLKSDDNYIALILLHIVFGFLFYFFGFFSKTFFTVVMLYFLWQIIAVPPSKKTIAVLKGCAYFVGAEVLFRMTKGGLAYEGSKYLIILFMLMGMFFKGISGKGYPYFLYLILLFPAVIIASITLTFDANFRTNIAFVLSGPVCLGVSALFCYDRKVTLSQLINVLLYMLYPLVASTTYLFLYNPSIKDTLSGTASNLATSGGFGPNQVATVLGLGMFVVVVRFFLKSPNLLLQGVNLVILGAMTFRAIVTFSRGGVIAAVLVVSGFMYSLFFRSSFQQKGRIIVSFVLLFVAISVTWVISSTQTMGLIDKRYANVDAQGREKEDLSTGRVELFMDEIDGFLESPFFGVGASRTKNKRVEEGIGHLPSHNEVGRLLAEHGFLGIVILMILIFTPLSYYSQNNRNIFFYAFLAFWFATINHSGMRIAAPAFLYALALIHVTNEKPTIHRKQLKY